VSDRTEYKVSTYINGRLLRRVIIDQHYRVKHAKSLNDQVILKLVRELDGGIFPVEIERGDFQYFTVEPVLKNNLPYRLVLLICITDDYLGVINAFRVRRKK
jgi:hypothetical protein